MTGLPSDLVDGIKEFLDDQIIDRGRDTDRDLRRAASRSEALSCLRRPFAVRSQEDDVVRGISSGTDGPQAPLVADRVADGVAVLTVSCELDMMTVPAFEQMLARETRAGHEVLIVDLSGCQFMGSSGLAALVEAHDRGRRGGTVFALAGLTRTLARGIAITGLDSVFDIYPSVEAAAAATSESGASPSGNEAPGA